MFKTWAGRLPGEIALCAVELPGRETRWRETPFTRMTPLVQTLASELRPRFSHGPFALYGHSMGALVAYELARLLRRRRLPGPARLFVSGHRAPQRPDPDPPIHTLPGSEFTCALRRLYDAPDDLLDNAELMGLFSPLLRADFAVCETYVYEPEEPLDCPISVFGGLHDRKVSREELAAWRLQTRGEFCLRMLPGNHFFQQSVGTRIPPFLVRDLTQVSGLSGCT